MIVVLLGPPGCGKGTQASLIARRYRIPAISTGELFRVECRAATSKAVQTSATMLRGGLVGDEIVNQMVLNRIGEPDCRSGFLLDGFPRTKLQAQFFDGLLSQRDLPEPTVIHLEVQPEVLLGRITSRRQCPACSRIYNILSQPPRMEGLCDQDGMPLTIRLDDTEEVIHQRLKAYEDLAGPVIAHYRAGRYYRVDGDRPPAQVHHEIVELLSSDGALASRGPARARCVTPVHGNR